MLIKYKFDLYLKKLINTILSIILLIDKIFFVAILTISFRKYLSIIPSFRLIIHFIKYLNFLLIAFFEFGFF